MGDREAFTELLGTPLAAEVRARVLCTVIAHTGSRPRVVALVVAAAAVVTTLWVALSLALTGSVASVAALAQPTRAPVYQDVVHTDEVGELGCPDHRER